MVCLPWFLVAVCIGIAVLGRGEMEAWMRVVLSGVTLYVLSLAILFTRDGLRGHSFRFLGHGHESDPHPHSGRLRWH